jgi:hypothetical protein
VKYGLWDSKDNCWFGNDKGPNQYDDLKLARCAATILNEQFNYGFRIRAREFPPGPVTRKDTVTANLSFAEALSKIEGPTSQDDTSRIR